MKIKRFKEYIKEMYDEPYYNELLDKYNKTKFNGMDNDEINYLKSGGESDFSVKYYIDLLQDAYNSYDLGTQKITKEDASQFKLIKDIITNDEYEFRIKDLYRNQGHYLDSLMVIQFMNNPTLLNTLKKEFIDTPIEENGPVDIFYNESKSIINLNIPKFWKDLLMKRDFDEPTRKEKKSYNLDDDDYV